MTSAPLAGQDGVDSVLLLECVTTRLCREAGVALPETVVHGSPMFAVPRWVWVLVHTAQGEAWRVDHLAAIHLAADDSERQAAVTASHDLGGAPAVCALVRSWASERHGRVPP